MSTENNNTTAPNQAVSTRRPFPEVINEWTDELLKLNAAATLEQIPTLLRLGLLGQRLIYESYQVGQNEILRLMKD